MKLSLKLLTATILLSAVNIEPSYCVDYYELGKLHIKKKLESFELDFEKFEENHSYHRKTTLIPNDILEKASEFCKYLFGNNGIILKTILNEYNSELYGIITNIFNMECITKHIMFAFVNNNYSCDDILNLLDTYKKIDVDIFKDYDNLNSTILELLKKYNKIDKNTFTQYETLQKQMLNLSPTKIVEDDKIEKYNELQNQILDLLRTRILKKDTIISFKIINQKKKVQIKKEKKIGLK